MADQYVAAIEGLSISTSAIFILDVALTAANRRLGVNEIGVTFNGASPTATSVIVRLTRTTTVPAANGTVTGLQAATPLDSSAPASLCTAYAPGASGWTTAPTAGVTLRTWYVPPTSGLVLQLPLGLELDSPATPAGAGFGLQLVAPAAVSVSGYLCWLE